MSKLTSPARGLDGPRASPPHKTPLASRRCAGPATTAFRCFVFASVSAASTLLSGCGDADPTAMGFTASREDPLLQHPDAQLWTNGQVPICFESRATSIEAQWLKDALKDNWTATAKLDFSYSTSCPFPNKTHYVKIVWNQEPGWGIGGVAGIGMHAPNTVKLGYCTSADCLGASFVDYREAFKSVAVHEIGHALGFAHEQQRADATPSCPLDTANSNNTILDDGIILTERYDADSIMNYCRGWDGSRALVYQIGYRAADRISALDSYGVQQAYGKRFAHWLYPSVSVPLL